MMNQAASSLADDQSRISVTSPTSRRVGDGLLSDDLPARRFYVILMYVPCKDPHKYKPRVRAIVFPTLAAAPLALAI